MTRAHVHVLQNKRCTYPWVVEAVTDTTIMVAAGSTSLRSALVTSNSFCNSYIMKTKVNLSYTNLSSIINTLTVCIYSNGVWTRDSSSGNLLEYLSFMNLWIVAIHQWKYVSVDFDCKFYLLVSLSISTAILLESTINWYSGSASTGPTTVHWTV